MADNVTGQVIGGASQTFSGVCRVGDLREKMDLGGNYKATVNGNPASEGDTLKDFDYVSFSESVKGGR